MKNDVGNNKLSTDKRFVLFASPFPHLFIHLLVQQILSPLSKSRVKEKIHRCRSLDTNKFCICKMVKVKNLQLCVLLPRRHCTNGGEVEEIKTIQFANISNFSLATLINSFKCFSSANSPEYGNFLPFSTFSHSLPTREIRMNTWAIAS